MKQRREGRGEEVLREQLVSRRPVKASPRS